MTAARMGRFAAIALVGLAAGGCSSNPLFALSDDSITVTAQFDNAAGLYEGNSVSILGMPVGKVTSVDPKGIYVEVTLSVDKGTKIPADAKAVTVSTSILTDRHIEFTPVYHGGETLQDNDLLGLDRTKTPVEFDRVLGMVDKLSVEFQGDGTGGGPVADLVNVGAAITSGNGQNMKAALDQLSQALRLGADNGANTKDAITAIVNNLNTLTKAAADNDSTIREFGSGVRELSDILADENLGSGDTGTKINQILLQAAALLQNNRGNLKSTVANSNTVVQAVTDFRREVSELFDVAPMLLENVYNATDQKNRGVRIHAVLDKTAFDGQMVKEVCNILGLRQLGCSTGTVQDFGPDFGLTGMLEGMAGLPR